MQPFISAYDRIDPLRRAAARRWRAYGVVTLGDAPDPRRDDPLTDRVIEYQQAAGCESCPATCPAPRFRLLHRAHRIYDQNGELRWELEARLLAGQGDREVARRTGLTRAVVAFYHDVFAVCRDRLGATDWVLWALIGPGPTVGFAPGDLGAVWRWVGYFGGPHTLDVLIAATSKQDRRHSYTEDVLESARRFVLAAQIPVTTRFSSMSALVGMAEETEQRRVPAEATIGSRLASSGAGGRRMTSDAPAHPLRRRGVGKPSACGATT